MARAETRAVPQQLLMLALGLLALVTLTPFSARVARAESGAADVRVVATDGAGLTLEVTVPGYDAAMRTGADGRTYIQLSIPGFVAGADAGAPDLPQRSVLLAVPPGATLGLNVQVLAERDVWLAAPVYPVSAQAADVEGGADAGRPVDPAMATGVRDLFTRDPAAYAARTPYPAQLAVLEEVGYVRDLRLARLTVYPLQYVAATGRLRHVQQMRVCVTFSGDGMAVGPATARTATRADVGGFDSLLSQAVINPDQVAAIWRADPPAPAFVPSALPLDRVRYRITLREAGIYQLTYDDLAGASVPVNTVDPRQLRLYHGDAELAIEVIGEGDGRFDPGDVVRFYGKPVDSFYTDIDTCWLVVGDVAGRRMAARSVAPLGSAVAQAFPAQQHYELDRIYRSSMPMASDVDHWYWGQTYVLRSGSVLTYTAPFTVEQPLPAGTASLNLELWGVSYDTRVNPDHHSRVFVNQALVGDVYWDGAVQHSATVTFDQALLRPGANTLAIYVPGDVGAKDFNNQPWEVTWLNSFDLVYQRAFRAVGDRLRFTPAAGPGEFELDGWSAADVLVYDVSDPLAPARLTSAEITGTAGAFGLRMHDDVPAGGAYYAVGGAALRRPLSVSADAPSGLHSLAKGADYLIISHADFLSGVDALAQFRRGQGLRVREIDVQDIYDEFSGGLLTPHAIEDFIRYAYFNWPRPAPVYVLLVGDGTYDFLNREGTGAQTFIPPYLANVDPVLGETAADNRYVTVVGDDTLPDLHLGRLPVNSQSELTAMLDKIIAYETSPAPGAWRTRVVFVADNDDPAGHFGALSDLVADHVPGEFEIKKIYLGTADYPLSFAVRAQQATLDAFNRGALLFNYVGHSSIGNWASELLFGVSSLPQVSNGSFYPVVLPMTCMEGAYHNPRYASLGENVVRLSGRGAVASWSPTGLGVASGHDYLHRGFYDALFNHDVRLLGPATTAGKLMLFTDGRSSDGSLRFGDLLDTYVLLGDPATSIGVPKAQLSITATGPTDLLTQGDPVTYTITYSNASPVRVQGVALTATLPAGLTDLAWQGDLPALVQRPGDPYTWDLAELLPGATGHVTITGRVSWDITAASLPFSAEMSISSRWTESDYSDNRAGPLIATVAPADLYLKQSVEPTGAVRPDQYVTFTLIYIDDGPGAAGGIRLELPLPVALDDVHVSESGPALTARPGATYAWDVAPMRRGDVGRLVLSGRIPAVVDLQTAVWTIAASITTTWVDPDPANNTSDPATLTVSMGDIWEPDDTQAQAQRVTAPLRQQPHTCYPLGDQDWTVFRAEAGATYLIRTANLSGDGDTLLFLRDAGGALLAKNDDFTPGAPWSQIIWNAPESGDYYLMVTSYLSNAGFGYDLEILPLDRTYLPLTVIPGQS